LLVSHRLHAERGADLAAGAKRLGLALELVVLPADPEGRLSDADCARLDLAFFSSDVFPQCSRQFFSTVRKAPTLQWLHVFNAGVDHPIYTEMLQRGVRLTTSAGSTAIPIAQTAITGLLMLARNFPRWIAAQRERKWDPARGDAVPRDLRGQTVIVVGLGTIGATVAKMCQALEMKVIGLRRSPKRDGDPVDEMHTLDKLPTLLPKCDWLVLACPYTKETHQLVNAKTLALMPKHSYLINVARGGCADEKALIAALQSKQIAGAYLDVFEKEPLPADSPLWDIPNVIVSPHNASASSGNDIRAAKIFTENIKRYAAGQRMENEQG
jgi:phosphoglycerate dehydrogenase-like enzyme